MSLNRIIPLNSLKFCFESNKILTEDTAEPESEAQNININAFDDLVGIISEREDCSEAHDRYLSEILQTNFVHHSHTGESRYIA